MTVGPGHRDRLQLPRPEVRVSPGPPTGPEEHPRPDSGKMAADIDEATKSFRLFIAFYSRADSDNSGPGHR